MINLLNLLKRLMDINEKADNQVDVNDIQDELTLNLINICAKFSI